MSNRLKDLVKKLSLSEKLSLSTGRDFWHIKGISRLNIPERMITDGPHGLRKQVGSYDNMGVAKSLPATCFPTGSALASTWNKDLMYSLGQALGQACLQEEVAVLLGPGINIKRHPLCGRNFEYLSEDPYVTAVMGLALIQGIQAQGVGATLKHYAVNHQEYLRMVMDVRVDDRALSDIYLYAFRTIIKNTHPWMVMGAYNKVNGQYACEHDILLNQVLRQAWGYQGVVVSDWGAVNDRIASARAGLDLEMPGNDGIHQAQLGDAVIKGDLAEDMLDQSAARLIRLLMKSEQMAIKNYTYDQAKQHQLARQIAHEGIVLLKNDNEILPLKDHQRVALVGDFAKNPRYQGSGSSRIEPTQLETVFDVLTKRLGPGQLSYCQGYSQDHDIEPGLISEACSLAQTHDITLVMIGLPDIYESEGFDRTHMRLPDSHNQLVEAICEVTDQAIVILSGGSTLELPWAQKVTGILEAYLLGQAGGSALVDILYGVVNPSGKLAETFAYVFNDYPEWITHPDNPLLLNYKESLFVGYRYFNTAGKPVRYPFGFGLSYTHFSLSGATLSKKTWDLSHDLWLDVMLENTGERDGQEVVQVYLEHTASVLIRPKRVLKAFKKVFVEAGKSTKVRFVLRPVDFEVAIGLEKFAVEPGVYHVCLGTSCEDIACVVDLTIEAEALKMVKDIPLSYQEVGPLWTVTDDDFKALLNSDHIQEASQPSGFHMNTLVGDMDKRWMGRLLLKVIKHNIDAHVAQGHETTARMLLTFIKEMPMRNIYLLSAGLANYKMVEGLIDMLNGKGLKGLVKVITGLLSRGKSV